MNLVLTHFLAWMVPVWWCSFTFQHCGRQSRPPFKMAAVTKNRNVFNCPFCFIMIKRAQILIVATWQLVVQQLFWVFLLK